MTPENQVKKAVLDLLAAEGIFAFRLNTGSFGADYKGKRRYFKAHSLGKGAADILAFLRVLSWDNVQRSKPMWIECKAGKGKQSAEQIAFQQFVEGHGHLYILARSSEDVMKVLQ